MHEGAEDAAIDGLCNPRQSLTSVPKALEVGARLYKLVSDFLDGNPLVQDAWLKAIGSTEEEAGPRAEDVDKLRNVVKAELGVSQTERHDEGIHPLGHRLLRTWASLASNPDADIVTAWLAEGGPAGIDRHIPDPAGIFPKSEQGVLAGPIATYQLYLCRL